MTLTHYTEIDCTVIVDSYHGFEMYVILCNLMEYLYHRERPND